MGPKVKNDTLIKLKMLFHVAMSYMNQQKLFLYIRMTKTVIYSDNVLPFVYYCR